MSSAVLWIDLEKKKRKENESSSVSGENMVLPELPRSENMSLRIVEERDELVVWKDEYIQFF